MRQEGAANILWVFHANNDDNPQAPWNRLENYYPGDEYIDLVGVSVYGALTPLEEEWPEFRPAMDSAYPRLAALSPGGRAPGDPGPDLASVGWLEGGTM